MEKWKDIKGYEGLYQVSNTGKVKSLYRKAAGSNRMLKEKILKSRPNNQGYCHVQLKKDGISKTVKVHRLVAFCFIPVSAGRNVVNHKDSIRHNNAVDNLEWTTDKENAVHASEKGRFKGQAKNHGEKNGMSKLDKSRVLQIRSEQDTLNSLARKFNVSPSLISAIKNKKRWAHV